MTTLVCACSKCDHLIISTIEARKWEITYIGNDSYRLYTCDKCGHKIRAQFHLQLDDCHWGDARWPRCEGDCTSKVISDGSGICTRQWRCLNCEAIYKQELPLLYYYINYRTN